MRWVQQMRGAMGSRYLQPGDQVYKGLRVWRDVNMPRISVIAYGSRIGPQMITAPDRRVKQLRFLIEDTDEKGKSVENCVKPAKIVLQVLKRVYLVELTANF